MDDMPITDQKKPHVVLIPFPAQSHIKCLLKLARLLHHKGLHITFVNTQSNHNLLLKSAGSHDLDGLPGFQFKTVPDGHQPPQTMEQVSIYLATNFLALFLDLAATLVTPVTCIISDGFMSFTKIHSAAEKLRLPIMLYWTHAACGFMGLYQAKILTEKGTVPLKDESCLTNEDLDTLVYIPGMKGIRLRDLPEQILGLKPTGWALPSMVEAACMAEKASHMIIHTFDELEAGVIKEIKSMFPAQIYTVGPLQLLLNQITEKQTKKSDFNGYSLRMEEPECIQWLESKEPNSVVYVNFGSLAVMSVQDLVELGWGLVNSNHYFVWIIRSDLVDGGSESLPPDLEEVIKERGFIGSWCSQEEVLNHPSVGAFLTHGGWGSVIESLSAGVPMMCWPFSGDQWINCRQMCKEWEFGVEIGRNVKREEVEKLVRELVGGVAKGERMRNKAMEWRTRAEMATGLHGSSSLNIEHLVNEISVFSRN